MGDLRTGSSDTDTENNFYCRELNFKIFDSRSNCKYVDVYLIPIIDNAGSTIKLPAHKVFLQNCPYFTKFLEISSKSTEVPVNFHIKSDPISTELVLKYIYTGQVEINENLIRVFRASKQFQLPSLTEKCLNVKNWPELFRFAVTKEGRDFRKEVFEFLRSISGQLIQSKDLLTLDFNEIKILLKPSNRIFPIHEDFNTVILCWITYQADRRVHITELSKYKWSDLIVINLSSDNEDDDNEIINVQNDENHQISQNNQIQSNQNAQNGQIQSTQNGTNHQNAQNTQIQSNQNNNDQMVKRIRLSVNHEIMFLVKNEFPNADSIYTFSFENQKITKLADMPFDSLCFGLISNKNKLFILGGYYNSNICDEMYSFRLNYDQEPLVIVSQLWKKEINLFQKLSHFSIAFAKESFYVVGGQNDANRSIRSIYQLTLDANENAQKWTLFSKIRMTRSRAGVAILFNTLFISGGRGRNVNVRHAKEELLDSFEMINLETKFRKSLKKMTNNKSDHQLVGFNNNLYAIGGNCGVLKQSGKRRLYKSKRVEIYNIVSGKWTFGPPMHDARSRFVAFATSSNIFVLGGNGHKGDLPTMEKFDPITNSWSKINCPKFPKGSDFCSYNVHITN